MSSRADQDGADALRLPAQGSITGQSALAAAEGVLARSGRLWDRCADHRPSYGGVFGVDGAGPTPAARLDLYNQTSQHFQGRECQMVDRTVPELLVKAIMLL